MNIGEIIKSAGLRATPQRRMIYELMTKLGHSSVDDIIGRVQQKNPEMTISTVYRIFDSFCKAGLLLKISHPSGKTYYDVNIWEHHHVLMNNEITDYVDPELTELIINHLKQKSFKHLNSIEKISLQIIVN